MQALIKASMNEKEEDAQDAKTNKINKVVRSRTEDYKNALMKWTSKLRKSYDFKIFWKEKTEMKRENQSMEYRNKWLETASK